MGNDLGLSSSAIQQTTIYTKYQAYDMDLKVQIKAFQFFGSLILRNQQFKISDFGYLGTRIFDKQQRDCSYAPCQIQGINQITDYILEQYLGNIFERIKQWKMLKYENGHFVWHIDTLKQRGNLQHFGTQILLPPLRLWNYKDGELQIKVRSTIISVKPDPKMWTHIIIPLGIEHRVKKVQGIRISFTKEIFLKENQRLPYNLTLTKSNASD